MDSVSNILGIDKVNMSGKLILIEEKHESNANFVLNSIILNALKKQSGICFVLFHNTLNHYHNMGMKFGYNLTLLKEQGKIKIIEPMKIIASNIESINEPTPNLNISLTKLMSNSNINIVHNLFTIIKDEYHKLKESNESVTIIIEDLSHLYDLGFNLESPVYYIRYLRSLLQLDNILQICIVMHTYKSESQDCIPNVFSHYLKHISHLYVAIDPLESGYSSDVCGKITINWKTDHIRKEYNLSETTRYIYTISNRQVKIHTLGTTPILT
ncbi:elongator complex protein 6 [Calliopsis andreniformis]|uniref:elongator complex protein 6 n=1 Tax=Calliopsis andreniformis TaxID=337506 RepID=UPI003FCD282C